MKITAVIAEYNPLHNGHLKLLKKARTETRPEALVVVMSGSFTERGDICVADKYTRANWALQCGADLVLELPTVYTLSTAKSFAEGALKTLSMLGEFTLCFGTETKELEELSYVAEFMQSESRDMQNMLRSYLSEGYSVAKSRTLALDKIRPDIANLVKSPNNILGVEYIKAGAPYGNKISFHSIERKPDNNKTIISSTKIRALMEEGKDYSAFVPSCVAIAEPTDMSKYGTVSTYSMRTKTAKHFGRNGKQNKQHGFRHFRRVPQTHDKTLYAFNDKADCGVGGLRTHKRSRHARKRKQALHHGSCRVGKKEKRAVFPSGVLRRIFLLQTVGLPRRAHNPPSRGFGRTCRKNSETLQNRQNTNLKTRFCLLNVILCNIRTVRKIVCYLLPSR